MAGLPDEDSLSTYGGAMSNYGIDVVDPTTDEDAAFRNLYAMNVAAMTKTVWRAIRSYISPSGTSPTCGDPSTGFVHNAVWGADSSVKAVGTYIATGTVDMIWPTMVTDELNVTHAVNFKRAIAAIESSDGTFKIASAKVTGARTVRIYTYGTNLTLANQAGEVVTVWVR